MGALDGKVVFITGAARGLGRAHAVRCAREGADVALFDISDLTETADQVSAAGQRALVFQGDLRDGAAVDRAVESSISELGQIDVLVSNAAILSLNQFWDIDEDQWQTMIDVVLTGTWRVAKAIAPHMIERGQGSMIFISSVNGLEAGKNYAHYTAAKHGVIGFMRSAALELGPYGIRANAICPGFIDTPINDNQESYDRYSGKGPGEGTPEDRILAAKRWSVLKGQSLIDPDAVSRAVQWLASDESSAVTGLVMPVDAGHMVLPGLNLSPA